MNLRSREKDADGDLLAAVIGEVLVVGAVVICLDYENEVVCGKRPGKDETELEPLRVAHEDLNDLLTVRVWLGDFEPEQARKRWEEIRRENAEWLQVVYAFIALWREVQRRREVHARDEARKRAINVRDLVHKAMESGLVTDLIGETRDVAGLCQSSERSPHSNRDHALLQALVRRLHSLAYGSDLLHPSGAFRPRATDYDGDALKAIYQLGHSGPTYWLARCLDGQSHHGESEDAEPSLERALYLWTCVHRALAAERDPVERGPQKSCTQASTDAGQGAGQAQRPMKVLVTEAFDALCKSLVGTPPADVDRLRCVMRLWLASDVVRHLLNNWPEGETGSLTYRRREAVRGVAACVREHLRYESHARWASCDPSDENSASKLGLVFDYLYQPGAVHDALCSLVHLHAHYVVGLPQTLDVRRLLRAIGDGRTGATRLVAAGHQQHVLDIYAFGHLLLKARYTEGTESQQRSDEDAGGNLSDTRSSAPRTLGGWLASRSESDPGKAAFVRLRQTFSLAVLYHDSGLLLFPRPRSIHPAVHRELRALRVPLQRVEEAHHNAGRELARVCRVELDTLGLASPQRDPGLATWLDEQEQEGRPDHALVGAWHLCRAAATSPAVDPDVLRAAARAILLHGAPTEVVHAEQDPAGWLLVLCDEVFEWDPNGRPDHGLQTVLRAPAGHGLQTGALRGRAEQISVSGLTLENKPKHVKDPKHHTPWPTIAVGGPGRRLWIRVQMVSPDQRDQSTVRAWLTTSQNVWRLDVPRSLAGGDAPRAVRLELCSVAPTQQTGQRTRELIERALHHVDLAIVGHLRQWADELALDEGSDVEPGGEVESSIGMEVLAIHPRGRPICDRDIRPYLDAVVDEARRWDRARR